jgi:hypothetical protein
MTSCAAPPRYVGCTVPIVARPSIHIEDFLARHANDIRGVVLEIQDDAYTKRFGKSLVKRSEVLSVSPGCKVTIVADLTSADQIPSSMFECIILTQTLQYIYDLPAAVRTIYRILAPGGGAACDRPRHMRHRAGKLAMLLVLQTGIGREAHCERLSWRQFASNPPETCSPRLPFCTGLPSRKSIVLLSMSMIRRIQWSYAFGR